MNTESDQTDIKPSENEKELGKKAPAKKNQNVPLSEEFQARTMDHLKDASKDELAFVRDQVYKHEEEMRKEESEPTTMDEYDTVKASD